MEKAFETHECQRDAQGITNHYQKFEHQVARGATGGIGKEDTA